METHVFTCADGPGEIWTLYNDPSKLYATKPVESMALELSRCCLFTVPIDYLYDSLMKSKPLLTVHGSGSDGILLGMALLNVQNMSLSEDSIKTLKAGGGVRTKKLVAHMSMFSVSPLSANDLGARLMHKIKAVAASLDSELFVIESLTVLKEYYSKYGFESTPIVKAGGGLTGMALKSSCDVIFDSDVSPYVLSQMAIADSAYSCCPTTPDFVEAAFLHSMVTLVLGQKDKLIAAKKLRDLSSRASLREQECLKLWKFRSKRLKQQKCEDLFTIIE